MISEVDFRRTRKNSVVDAVVVVQSSSHFLSMLKPQGNSKTKPNQRRSDDDEEVRLEARAESKKEWSK
jgi:hypothetical protein